MAEPDCEGCAIAGYRACDVCGSPVMDRWRGAMGQDLCYYHRPDEDFPPMP